MNTNKLLNQLIDEIDFVWNKELNNWELNLK